MAVISKGVVGWKAAVFSEILEIHIVMLIVFLSQQLRTYERSLEARM